MTDDPLKMKAACPRCSGDLTVTADLATHLKTIRCDGCGASASDFSARDVPFDSDTNYDLRVFVIDLRLDHPYDLWSSEILHGRQGVNLVLRRRP